VRAYVRARRPVRAVRQVCEAPQVTLTAEPQKSDENGLTSSRCARARAGIASGVCVCVCVCVRQAAESRDRRDAGVVYGHRRHAERWSATRFV
jgi:hypothetical protein